MTYTVAVPAALPNLLALIPNLIAARAVASLDGSRYKALVDVRRLSDNATTTLYSNGSGFIDTASATNFQAASTIAVSKVYDQFSTHHAVQTDHDSQPYLIQNPVTGIWEIQEGDVNGRGNRFLVLPESLSNSDAFTFYVGRTHGNYDSDPFFNFDAGLYYSDNGASGFALSQWMRGPQNTVNYQYQPAGFSSTPGQPWDSRNQVVGLKKGPNVRIRRYPDINFNTNPATYLGTDTWTVNQSGGNIGGLGITPSAYVQCLISAGSVTNFGGSTGSAILSGFQSFFSPGTPTKSLYWFGDSWSDGYIPTLVRDSDRGIPIRLQGALGGGYVVHCGACAGFTIAQIEASAVAHFDNPAVRESGMPADAVILAGYNDVFQGADAATTLLRLQSFVNHRKAAGASKMVVCTLPIGPNFLPGDPETLTLQAINSGIPHLSNVDRVIDLASQTFVFQADGIHPTTPGDVWTAARYAAPRILVL